MHFSDQVLEQHERLARFLETERESEFEGAPPGESDDIDFE